LFVFRAVTTGDSRDGARRTRTSGERFTHIRSASRSMLADIPVRRPSIKIADVNGTNAPLGNTTRQRSVSTLRIDRDSAPSGVSCAVLLLVRVLREDLRSELQARGVTARVEQTRGARLWDGLVDAPSAARCSTPPSPDTSPASGSTTQSGRGVSRPSAWTTVPANPPRRAHGASVDAW
jgi:hypothetical protein